MKVIRKVIIFLFKLGDFAPWREEFPNPRVIRCRIFCAGPRKF
jgi:hypothetical protein